MLGGISLAKPTTSDDDKKITPIQSTLNDIQYTRMLHRLCPHKLRLAMLLADYGLMKQARGYADFIKRVAEVCTAMAQIHNQPASRRGAPASKLTSNLPEKDPSSEVKLVNKRLLGLLDEFIDRLEGKKVTFLYINYILIHVQVEEVSIEQMQELHLSHLHEEAFQDRISGNRVQATLEPVGG
jgi:hypothetical protein